MLVLMYGKAYALKDWHYWVIDGYLEFWYDREYYVKYSPNQDWTLERTEKNVSSEVLVHCNWGWGSTNNGFFHPNVFIPEESERGDHDLYSSDSDTMKTKGKKGNGDLRRKAKAFYTYEDENGVNDSWIMPHV